VRWWADRLQRFGSFFSSGHWVPVAGSVAVSPGAGVFRLAGFPIGVWSLVVLFRPEIRASCH
jgi:hypothetical protein